MQQINTNAVISMQNVKIAMELNVCVKMHITGMQLHALHVCHFVVQYTYIL
jgi:hypothetical protein